MLREQIVATNDVDRQNQRITDRALLEMANRISSSASVARIGVNHDTTMMPMGKVLWGKVVNTKDGGLELRAVLDDFSEDYSLFAGPDNEKLYWGYSHNDTRPFADSVIDTDRKITVALNPIDFTDEAFCEICENIIESENGEVITLAKKAEWPEIEIILTVAKYVFAYLLVQKTLEKTTDKLADRISDDIASVYNRIKRVVKNIFSKNEDGRTITCVINSPDQPIELVVQCNNACVVSCAMDKIDDGYISDTYQKFTQYLNGGVQKMQFLYDNQSEKWELNYILSEQGQVIGTEKCYDKSIALYRKIMKTPGAGFSIGAAVDYEVAEILDT